MRKSFIMLAMLFFGCETTFEPNIPKDEQLVVNAFFRPEAPFQVHLTTSNFIVSPEIVNPFAGARVELSTSDGLFETLTDVGNGRYIGEKIVDTERIFSLNVSAAGFPDLRSSDQIPEKVAVGKFEIDHKLRAVNLEDSGYPLSLTFDDPQDVSNYYAMEVIILNVSNPNNSGNIFAGDVGELFFEDTEVNIIQNVEIDIGGFGNIEAFPTLYFDDLELVAGANTIEFFLSPSNLNPEDFDDHEIYVVLKSVSKAYYEFLRSTNVQREVIDLGLPADPVQIQSNIENGLGIFGGYNFSIMRGTVSN